MARAWLQVAVCAVGCGVLGIWAHHLTSDFADAAVWRILSFGALGACIGCLLTANPDSSDFDFWL